MCYVNLDKRLISYRNYTSLITTSGAARENTSLDGNAILHRRMSRGSLLVVSKFFAKVFKKKKRKKTNEILVVVESSLKYTNIIFL